MIQTLYAFIAIIMLALVALTMNNSIHANESRMILTEVHAPVTNIANEFFEQISTLPYDPVLLVNPSISDKSNLAVETEFGTENCQPEDRFLGCFVMNDLHGHTVERTVDGLTFEVEITLCYVDETDPSSTECPSDGAPLSPTFAKRAVISITSQDLTFGANADPLTFNFNRLYGYPRVTG